MNKRIQELVKQATITKTELRNGWERKTYTYQEEVFDKEKFAELLVNEVYDYILNATLDDGPWPDHAEVKRHFFGVEDAPVDNVDRILRTIRTRG